MSPRLLTHGALLLLVLIWGTTWAAIRIGLEGIPPFTGVALRFAIASVILLAAARLLGVSLQTGPRARILGAVNGLLSFSVSYGVVYWAEQWVPSGLAAVLFATFPLFVAGLAHFLLPGERLGVLGATGIVLGFVGVLVLVSEDLASAAGQGVTLVALVFLVSPLAVAVANVVIKRWGEGIHSFSLNALPMAGTALLMGGLAVLTESHAQVTLDRRSVAALLYLSVAGTAVTFLIYFWLLSRLRATRLALITYGIPVVAVLVGRLFLDEPFTPRMAAGTLLILLGVVLAMRERRVPDPPLPPVADCRSAS